MSDLDLINFVTESNAIEGIHREPTSAEIRAHEDFLGLPELHVGDLENLVNVCAGAPLRDKVGRNVVIGNHLPPPGGPEIRHELALLLLPESIASSSPHQLHKRYETLHPFMDGNGRSGRALWASHHKQLGNDPFVLEFLRLWYYESLAESQGR